MKSACGRSIVQHIAFLTQQIAELEAALDDHIDQHLSLQAQVDRHDSIPGIGPTTAQRTSGSSVRGKTTLSKKGNDRLRAALYMPALSTSRSSPPFHAFADRLRNNGKSKMAVIGAVMHKLIRVIYGVLKSGQRFDPNQYLTHLTP